MLDNKHLRLNKMGIQLTKKKTIVNMWGPHYDHIVTKLS